MQITKINQFKSMLLLLILATTIAFNSCKKCKSCVHACYKCYTHDTLAKKYDTVCSSNFHNLTELGDTLSSRLWCNGDSVINPEHFSSCDRVVDESFCR